MAHYRLFIFAGQSNASGYSPLINLGPTVPEYAQTAANEWTGAPPRSIDTNIEYPYPTSLANPCLYCENTRGTEDGTFDAWGTYEENSPQYNSSGALGDNSSYGPELTFLASIRDLQPTWNLAAIKCALGGTSLRDAWLPNTVTLGTAQAGSSTSITLASNNFYDPASPVNLVIRVTSGTGVGSTGTCTAYNSSTKVATVTSWSGTAPSTGSTYGIEQKQFKIMRTMYEQAIARFAAAGHTFEVVGLSWMQGENGAHDPSIAPGGSPGNDNIYLSDSRAFYAAVRSMTGTPNLPIIIGRIGNQWGWETTPNTYLTAAGYPYAALDASYWFSHDPFDGDGRNASPDEERAGRLAGAVARRATQATLGADDNCVMVSTDDCPLRPPFSLTAALTDLNAYHLGGPGNMAVGERMANAFAELTGIAAAPPVLCISTSAGLLSIAVS